ncbi:MAG TPA: branched-chain amino acid ABC transporter permease [Solirubrobacteraceae bacterium]
MDRALQLTASGLLLAGLYAMLAYGLALVYGVMKVVNLAHGGTIMLAAFFTWALWDGLGLYPLLGAVVAAPVFFVIGAALYLTLVRRMPMTGKGPSIESLLLLFGVWTIMRSIAYLIWGGDDHSITTATSQARVTLGSVSLPDTRLIAFAVGVLVTIGLATLVGRTRFGRAIRAAAQDPGACRLVGIDIERINAVTFGLAASLGAIGGGVAATIFAFNPEFGAVAMLKAFVIIVLGGMGSIAGVALGALVLALTESYATLFVESALTNMVGFVMLVAVLVLRPEGLLGKRAVR